MISWFTNLKVQTRLLLVFSITILFAAIIVGWNVYKVIQMDKEVQRVVKDAFELAEIEDVQVYLLEQQLAISDFRVSGSNEHLAKYLQSQSLADYFLRQAMADAQTIDQRDMLSLISSEMEIFNNGFDEVIELYESGDHRTAVELANDIAGEEESRVDQIHEQVERFVYKGELQLQ